MTTEKNAAELPQVGPGKTHSSEPGASGPAAAAPDADLVRRLRDRAAFCPIGERNLDDEAAARIEALPKPQVRVSEEAVQLLRSVVDAGDDDGIWVNNWAQRRRKIRDFLLRLSEELK